MSSKEHRCGPDGSKGTGKHRRFKIQRQRHNGTTWQNAISIGADDQIFARIVGKKKPGRKPGQTVRLQRSPRAEHDGHCQHLLPPESRTALSLSPNSTPTPDRLRDIHILPANLFTGAIRVYPKGTLPAPAAITSELREVVLGRTTNESVRIQATLFDLLHFRGLMPAVLTEQHGRLYHYTSSLLNGSRSGPAWHIITAQAIGTLALLSVGESPFRRGEPDR